MGSTVFVAYLYSSWFCFIMAWFVWLVCLILAYLEKTLFSWKTVRATVIPCIITVLAVFPPYSILLGFLYLITACIAFIIYRRNCHDDH
jgi:hypothetical protein